MIIKKLAKCVREYKVPTILTPISVALEVVLEVAIPLIMAKLIDEGIDVGNLEAIKNIGLILLAAAVLALIFGALAGQSAAKASAGFAKNVRKDLYYKVQDFSFSNIDKFSNASLVTRLTTDVTNVQNAFQMLIRIAFRAPLMLIFCLVMGFSISAKLSVIFLILAPLVGVGLYFIITTVHPIISGVFKKYDQLNSCVEENVNGIRVVKSFVIEEEEKQKFKNISNIIYRDFSRAEKILILNNPLMQFGIYTCVLLVAWFGTKLIISTGGMELSTGELSTLISYGIQLLMSLMMLSMTLVMLTISKASAERIVEVLDEKSNLINNDEPLYEIKDGSIEFENVSFSYVDDKEKECLKGVNIKINSGDVIGIIGGTGTSKSTLVNLIPRLYDATEGVVKVGGKDVKNYDIETLRNNVAMVLQKNVLFSGTISENIKWGDLSASDEDVKRVCTLAQADEFINNFPEKYDTYIEQGGTNVSGGQKQRLCIARALLKKPKILILDDSTSAVDTKTDKLIRKALRDEIPNTTKIIIAQRIASIEDSDKIIVMDNGKVSGFGTHEELLENNKIYREVYESQVGGGNSENER